MIRRFIVVALLSLSQIAMAEDQFIGEKDAPITLVEYGSLTCDACNYFHRTVLPSIKAKYIDLGKVRYIYRHFPTDIEALHGAIAAECAGDKTFEMLNVLYLNVEQWGDDDDPQPTFVKYAQDLGVDSGAFKQCLTDEVTKTLILNQQREASTKYNVIGTPTFILNGEVIKGKKNFDQMEALFKNAKPTGKAL